MMKGYLSQKFDQLKQKEKQGKVFDQLINNIVRKSWFKEMNLNTDTNCDVQPDKLCFQQMKVVT